MADPIELAPALKALPRQANVGTSFLASAVNEDRSEAEEYRMAMVVAGFAHLEEIVKGLAFCVASSLYAPAQALTRAAWEVMLNIGHSLVLKPEEIQATFSELNRVTAERLKGNFARLPSVSRADKTTRIEQSGHAGAQELAAALRKADELLYASTSDSIHGNHFGTFSTLTSQGLKIEGHKLPVEEGTELVSWTFVVLHFTLRFCIQQIQGGTKDQHLEESEILFRTICHHLRLDDAELWSTAAV